jgi:hypothetical protein
MTQLIRWSSCSPRGQGIGGWRFVVGLQKKSSQLEIVKLD